MIELGVFLPVTNNGWIISKTSPQFRPTFALNREICTICERIGFQYVFSMAKWRGFGGETDFWKHSIESMTLMAGLAPLTTRLRLIASIAPVLVHPAIFAKMAATLDEIADGRLGINIVSAGNRGEYSQMGLYPEDFESYRYDYTEEWLTVVKRLWTEESVSYQGQYFTLDDCQSWPKPVQGILPIVCATSSERGFQFVAEHCTDAFFGGNTLDTKKATSRRIKEIGQAHGRAVRTHTLVMLIQGDTDADAERLLAYYQAGADVDAIANVYHLRARDKDAPGQVAHRERFESSTRLFYGGVPFVAGPARVAAMVEELAVDGAVDGIMFVFPDFVDGLTRFDAQVMPLLRQRGLVAPPDATEQLRQGSAGS